MRKFLLLAMAVCLMGITTNANAGLKDLVASFNTAEAEYANEFGSVGGKISALQLENGTSIDDQGAAKAYIDIAGIYQFNFNVMANKTEITRTLIHKVVDGLYVAESSSITTKVLASTARKTFELGYDTVVRPFLATFLVGLETAQIYAAQLQLLLNVYVEATQDFAVKESPEWGAVEKMQVVSNEYVDKAQEQVDAFQDLMVGFDGVAQAIEETSGNSEQLKNAIDAVVKIADTKFNKDVEAYYVDLHANFGSLVSAGFEGAVAKD